MKCLSVNEPWASLLIYGHPRLGYKDVENRTWSTTYRGPILIHAGKTVRRDAYEFLGLEADYPLHNGGIIGFVTLWACQWGSQDSHWHENGCIGWYVRDPVPFLRPIACPGQLGLYDVKIECDVSVKQTLDYYRCPKCDTWLPTPNDRHGVMWHEGCGYCTHPSVKEGVCERCHDSIQA